MRPANRLLMVLVCASGLLVLAAAALVGAQTEEPPDDPRATVDALMAMGGHLMVTPNPFEAVDYFDAAIARIPDDRTLYLRAASNFPDADHQLRYIDWGLRELPADAGLHLERGHILYNIYADEWVFENQYIYGDPQDALDDALQSYALAQALGAADRQMYLNLGSAASGRGEWAFAVALYTAGLERYTGSQRLYAGRARAHLGQEDYQAAERDARALLDIRDTNPDAWLLLGHALNGQNDVAGALDAYRRHVELADAAPSYAVDPTAVEFIEVHATPGP